MTPSNYSVQWPKYRIYNIKFIISYVKQYLITDLMQIMILSFRKKKPHFLHDKFMRNGQEKGVPPGKYPESYYSIFHNSCSKGGVFLMVNGG